MLSGCGNPTERAKNPVDATPKEALDDFMIPERIAQKMKQLAEYGRGNEYLESVAVCEARPILGYILCKATTASGALKINGDNRIILHSPPCHASATKLPWPFSFLEMHDVGICNYKNNEQIGDQRRFTKDRINEAIEEFLNGAQPADKVMLTAEFHS